MSASSSSSDPAVRVPLLGGSTGGGLAYPQWRPQMKTHLLRQGIEDRDYNKEIPQWSELVAVVVADAESEEQAAIALLLGSAAATSAVGKSVAAASSSSTKVKAEDAAVEAALKEQSAAKKSIAAMIGRSRKAFTILHSALPAELRPLVADVPQGYAFGIWSFLEKKYRNTEQDSVASLWSDFTTLGQEPNENFDTYKARVDSVVELLTHAKQVVPSGLYTSLLLWRLQGRYATAVLTLKTGNRVTDTDKIDWPAIVEYMSQYERAQLGLGESESAERTMAARARPPWQKSSSPAGKQSQSSSSAAAASKRPLSEVTCFNCQKKGHFANHCTAPRSARPPSQHRRSRSNERHPSKQSDSSWSQVAGGSRSSNSSDDESDRPSSKKPSERTNMVRTSNRYSELEQPRDEVEPKAAPSSSSRSYAALALVATTSSKASSAASSASTASKKSVAAPAAAAASASTSTPAAARVPVSGPDAAPPRSPKPKAKSLDDALKTTAKAVDTAATVSTSCSRESLHNVRRCQPMPIRMADGTTLSAMHKGDLLMRLPVSGKPDTFVRVTIQDVYYHERFDANLLSWGNMRKAGWEMHSTEAGTHLITPRGSRIDASTRGNLTILEDTSSERVYGVKGSKDIVCVTAKELLQLHRRLGHVSWTRLIEMCSIGATIGVADLRHMSSAELSKAERAIRCCTACAESKAHRKPLGHVGLDKGARAGEVLHMDTFHSITRDPTSGKKRTQYCLVAVDAFSEWRWNDVKDSFADVPQAAIDIIQHSHTLTGRYPRLLIADLGTEFENKTMREYCRKNGIQFQPSPARAKEINGLAEKNVDTMKNHVRAMLHSARMPDELGWTYAIQHFVFVWNRTHIGQHTRVTPYQSMTSREASVLNIGEFGCDVYVHQHRLTRDTTFDRKAEPGVYLGHSGRMNCPIVLMLRSGKTVMSKDVHFREGSFSHLRALTSGHLDDIEPVDLGAMDNPALDMDDLDSPLPSSRNEEKYPESEAEESIEDTRYTLKSITDVRLNGGVKEYRCKWVGYSAATWEPAASIQQDAPDAVRDYESFIQARSSRVTRQSAASSQKAVTFSSAAASSSSSSDDEELESDPSMAAAYAARRL